MCVCIVFTQGTIRNLQYCSKVLGRYDFFKCLNERMLMLTKAAFIWSLIQ